MKRRTVSGVLLVSLAAVAIAGLLVMSSGRAHATGTGPTMSIGTPSLVSGKVQVPVSASGGPPDPYIAFNIHLRFDPAVFSFASANNNGTVLPSPFCPAPVVDADGAGVIYACSSLGGSTTADGLIATIVLTPVASGCSNLHLFTLDAPDNGDSNTGTYTVNNADFTPQSMTYGPDVTANQLAATCAVPGTPTTTPTPSQTATPTATPTPPPTPTSTATSVSGAPDVVVAAFGVPSSIASGSNISYSIIASNIGDSVATGVRVDLTLPIGSVPFQSAGCHTYIPGHWLCDLPNLAANDHVAGGPDEQGVIVNTQGPLLTGNGIATAIIHVTAANEPLANTGNNSTQVQTNVTGCPDLDADNQITILDMNIAAASFGKQLGDPGYNPLADQNGDNMITVADMSIIASHYLQSCKGVDTDHDGLSNYDEIHTYHTDPLLSDTDGDGLPDGVEVLTYGSNPFVADTDGDGYTDAEEAALGKSPTVFCIIMATDLDKDHTVTILDINNAASAFLTATGNPGFKAEADVNRDGTVNILDLNLFAQNFLKNVSACP